MAGQTVRVVARIVAQPGRAEAMEAVLMGLIAPTRSERGCISYQLMQDTDDPARFVFVEEWASAEAIDAHMRSPHLRDAIERAAALFAEAPEIRTYRLLA